MKVVSETAGGSVLVILYETNEEADAAIKDRGIKDSSGKCYELQFPTVNMGPGALYGTYHLTDKLRTFEVVRIEQTVDTYGPKNEASKHVETMLDLPKTIQRYIVEKFAKNS